MQSLEFRVDGAGRDELVVPTGRSWLRLPAGEHESPELAAGSAADLAGAETLIALETLDRAGLGIQDGGALLAALPSALDARLNGQSAPPLAVLRAGDRLEVPGGLVLHLVATLRPELGPPPPAAVGAPCGVCRTPIAARTRVYVCRCGAVLHAEDEGPPSDRLECSSLATSCPACQAPIQNEEVTIGVPQP